MEHQIFSFGKMILRDRCNTSYDMASLFRGSLPELLRFGCFQVQKLRKSRRIAEFSSSQIGRQTGRQTDRQIDNYNYNYS